MQAPWYEPGLVGSVGFIVGVRDTTVSYFPSPTSSAASPEIPLMLGISAVGLCTCFYQLLGEASQVTG